MALKGPALKELSSSVNFVPFVFGTIHLTDHERRVSSSLLMFGCWDGVERGRHAHICKDTQKLKKKMSSLMQVSHCRVSSVDSESHRQNEECRKSANKDAACEESR